VLKFGVIIIISANFQVWKTGSIKQHLQVTHQNSCTGCCYRAMLYTARTMLSQDVCPSVRASHEGILSKRLDVLSNFFSPSVSTPL